MYPAGMKLRKRYLWALPVVALIAGAGITYGATSSTTIAASPVPPGHTVTVAALPAADLAGLYIAQDDGLFAAQGLRVIIKPASSTAAVIAAQQQGRVDVAGGSYVPYIAAEAAGARFRVLAPESVLQPYVRELLVARGSGITTLAGLKGKTIGVNGTGSVGTLLTDMLLSDHGVAPQSVRYVTDPKGFPGLPGNLQAGRYAAAYLGEPYITTAELTGVHALADFDQGSTVGYEMDGYVATQAWVQRNPAIAAAFIRALGQGQQIARTDALAVHMAVEKYDHLSPEITTLMAMPGYPVGGPNVPALQAEAMDMLQFGLVSRSYAAEITSGALIGQMTAPVVSGHPASGGAPAAPQRIR